MASLPDSQPVSQPAPEPLICPEDVDWIFDVDTLRSAGSEALVRRNGLEEAPPDCPHYPFNLSANSAVIWDQAVRRLSMAAGESHLVITAHSNTEAREIVFYARVAGFREQGLPRIAATFQRIDQSSFQSVADNVRRNWLYLLHEIKNPLSILKAADNLEYQPAGAAVTPEEAAQTRRFAIACLEQHLRNGVFLATEDSRLIPMRTDPVDLHQFFEELKATYRVLLRMQRNTLEVKLDMASHQVARIDTALLAQLLNNLLLNKLNQLKNQTVRLECGLSSTRPNGSGPLLVITIEDEGPAFPDFVITGIDKEPDLEGLLRTDKGAGLGLPICRRIASVMGGEIRFFNDPPKTRTRILLPLG